MIRLSLRAALAALFVAASAGACTPPIPEGRFACTTNADCPDSFQCGADSLCRSELTDAGTDTGPIDSGFDSGSCPSGFITLGTVCVDIDECVAATSPCAPTQVCTNTSGSFTCACPSGQVMGATACVPNVDECATNTDDCGAHAHCTNTADAFTCACDTDYAGDGYTCTLDLCNPGADVDTGTATIVVTHLSVADGDGFDLDELNNAPAPGGVGQNVAGCGRTDIAGGLDNMLASLAASLLGVFDLDATYQEPITAGTSVVTLTFNHLAAGNAANDACIGGSMLVQRNGQADQVAVGRGRLADNVALVHFDDVFSLQILSTPEAASCTGGICNPGTLATTFRGGRGRFALNAAHTDVTAGVLGGFLFLSDANGGYAPLNAAGLEAAINNYATQTNLANSFQTMLVQAFASGRDLHMLTDGTLDYCSGPNTSTTDKNSISGALSIDSL